MNITAPVAWPEERVEALNYKMRPAVWERGEVRNITYVPRHVRTKRDGGTYVVEERWTYEVFIDRPRTEDRYGRQRGGGYTLTLCGEQIRL